jgi:hypothetical protein
MSEDAPTYGNGQTHLDEETRNRIKLEACAMRHVFNLDAEQRPDAARRWANASLGLYQLAPYVANTLEQAPNAKADDILVELDRSLNASRLDLIAAGALDIATGTEPLEPNKAKAAYEQALQDTARAADLRKITEAKRMLEQADKSDPAERKRLMREAVERIAQAERQAEEPLANVWQEHLQILAKDKHRKDEAVMLDESMRGGWAGWFNANLGPRGGLSPGRTLLIGGGPGGGKTSMAAALAVDALAAGCPVTFWQLELGVGETLEHLMAQDPTRRERGCDHWASDYAARAKAALPAHWSDLLTIPRWPDSSAEACIDAMQDLARRCRRMRDKNQLEHDCNGLFIVDYVQLLTMQSKEAWKAGHEVITDAISKLAKAAAEAEAVLVLLSQVTKDSRKEGTQISDGTEFSGADIARAAHAAVTIGLGHYDEAGVGDDHEKIERATMKKPCEFVSGKGEPRIAMFSKRRGVWHDPMGEYPKTSRGIWYSKRALYGGPQDGAKGRQGQLGGKDPF